VPRVARIPLDCRHQQRDRIARHRDRRHRRAEKSAICRGSRAENSSAHSR
jgi:hypothetical protein